MYEELRKIIDESEKIVFFGGAGVSTESGVPDFRSENGLWNAKTRFHCTPEEIVSHTFFMNRTDDFYEYYMQNLVFPDVKPNTTHYALAKLEQMGKLRAIITQNIDGLHQAAGSKNVLELHGSIHRCYCMRCGRPYPAERVNHGTGVPHCDCGGIIRPDIVFYEECLDDDVVSKAVHYIREAEVLIVGGTSLAVYPAAGLLNYYRGSKLVLINRSATPYDDQANLIIHEKIGEVFAQV